MRQGEVGREESRARRREGRGQVALPPPPGCALGRKQGSPHGSRRTMKCTIWCAWISMLRGVDTVGLRRGEGSMSAYMCL